MQPTDYQQNTGKVNNAQRDAASNIIRHQIDNIYSHEDQSSSVNNNSQPHQQITLEEWNKYHSAWQDYYKKYYEGYYNYHLNEAKQSLVQNSQTSASPSTETSRKQITDDLRSEIRSKITSKAKKVTKSRHFIPIFLALVVMILFVGIQYNRLIVASVSAYVSPGSIDPQNIIIDPNNNTIVSKDPKLIIPKINVDVPVIYDAGNDHDSQMAAMEKGVAHFSIPGASSHPGEIGNTVIAGHSSNDIFGGGDYKFIFAQLEKLKPGDNIYANYQGVRYGYVVTRTEVVKPNQVDKLLITSDKPTLTLVTCTPLGTATNRLLVFADQVSPDPASAKKPAIAENTSATEMPSNSPTLIEWILNLFN